VPFLANLMELSPHVLGNVTKDVYSVMGVVHATEMRTVAEL